MLSPDSRHVYLDALRPPVGFTLERAIGSTYSLDLDTLLAVPLGFAMLDWENERGALARDPVALLHALRRCADRVTVFCQAGRIAASAKHHPLFAHLESMIVEANTPAPKGSFHAKTWLLRFVDGEQRVIHRFLCLSRNLTPDRSWDTILTLDGEVGDRQNGIARNQPLADFLNALPEMASTPLPAPRVEAVRKLAAEVRRAKFEAPEPFENFKFWPLGIARHEAFPLFGSHTRVLVVSPFLSESTLKQLSELQASVLISRAESLEPISANVLKRFKSVYVLDDAAVEEEVDAAVTGGAACADVHAAKGLHAKVYIADQGWDASVWTGSANASNSAFERNVEFLVQLTGKKSKVGIDEFLGGEEGGFQALLRRFEIGDATPVDVEAKANEERVESLRRELARAGLKVRVQSEAGGTFELVLQKGPFPAPDLVGAHALCWPASLRPSMAHDLNDLWHDGELRFGGLTIYALTSFLAFEVSAGKGSKSVTVRFMLNLPMEGAPEDRIERVLQAILSDKEHLLRYLLFLLARDEDLGAIGAALLESHDRRAAGGQSQPEALPLFEELLRALARSPEKLGAVARVVADLKRTPEGAALLPEGFEVAWQAIWGAHATTMRTDDDRAA